MPESFCTICRTRIPRGSRCSRHRTVSPSSRSWHQPGAARLRAQLTGPGACCQRCGGHDRLEVHHVIAAADRGPATLENLVVLCHYCHLKAEAEKRIRAPRSKTEL
jgi:5-methylcytosine-specific restriction endonuclease McrA